MGRQYVVKLLLGLCIDPTAGDAATRENERVLALTIDNGELDFAVKRRAVYRLPVHSFYLSQKLTDVLDLNHLT